MYSQEKPPCFKILILVKKVVIFDFDGTVADTLQTVVSVLNSFSRSFGYKFIEQKDVEKDLVKTDPAEKQPLQSIDKKQPDNRVTKQQQDVNEDILVKFFFFY